MPQKKKKNVNKDMDKNIINNNNWTWKILAHSYSGIFIFFTMYRVIHVYFIQIFKYCEVIFNNH